MSKLDSLQRYLILIQKIRKTPYCNKVELLQYLNEQLEYESPEKRGLSDRTFERIISDVKTFLGISIEYSKRNKGYFIPEDEDQHSIVEKILEPLQLLHAMVGDDRLPEYVHIEKRRSIGTEYLADIMRAIRNSRYLSIEYSKFYPEISDNKVIQPYALKESRGRWYVLAFEKGSNMLKSYGLDRIISLSILGGTFIPITSTDITDKYRYCFAMFTSEEAPQKIVLSFDERDGHYIETMPIHSSQKIVKQENRIIVELYMCITLDLIMELMSRTWSIEVIEPQSLKEEFCRIYREALARNS